MGNVSTNKAALLGSASALGYHWVYDPFKLFDRRDSGHPMIFEEIDHEFYKKADNTYDVYPHHKAGDLDFMGEVLYITHRFLETDNDGSLEAYRAMFYDYFKEDSPYNGWVEGYAKDFLKQYKAELDGTKEPQVHTTYVDKQLVGLLFVLAVLEHDSITDKVETAVNYAKTLSSYEHIEPLSEFLLRLFEKLDEGHSIQDALTACSVYIPDIYRENVLTSKEDMDIVTFAQNHAGIACGLDQSLALIFYILNHTSTWEEAMVLNASIGGASSNRGIFISAIASRYLDIPEEYLSKLNYDVK